MDRSFCRSTGARRPRGRREGLAIARTLAAKDPGNTQWQRDIAASLNNVGGLLTDQGDLPGALAAHREELAIDRALAAKDANNTDWQADIALALIATGDVLGRRASFPARAPRLRRASASRVRSPARIPATPPGNATSPSA